MTKPEGWIVGATPLLGHPLSLIRHSSFVIRHSDNGYYRSTTKTHLVRAIVLADNRSGNGDHAPAFQKYAPWPHQGDDAVSRTKMGFAVAGILSRRACFSERRGRPSPLCRLSALRIHLSAAGDQNRAGRNSRQRSLQQGREVSTRIRYRHDSLHLLRDV